MSSKKSAARATRTAGPARPAAGPEAGQEATAASTPSIQATSTATLLATKALQQQEVASLTSPAVEAFTPKGTAPQSTEAASNAAPQPTQPSQPCDVVTTTLEELQAELRPLQELERWQQMKEQILPLHAKVSHSSKAEGRATITALAPTASLPTIAVHPAATVPLLEPAMSVFSAGIPPVTGASTVPVWGAIPLMPQATYPLAYPYPLLPTRLPVL